MDRWQIGKFTITRIDEMPVEVGTLDGLIAEATPEVVRSIEWLYPRYATAEGQTLWSLHAYLVQADDVTMLVDAGCGNGKTLPLIPEWGGLETPFLERLREAGAEADEVEYVVTTHLHLDHVGWNTVLEDGVWKPTFPNARYIVVRDELAYHREIAAGDPESTGVEDVVTYAEAAADVHSQTRIVFEESLQPCIDAGLVDVVEADHQVVPGVRYISTPGHTRGHCSLVIESEGATAVITGDLIHHPIQIARPLWSSANDWDLDQSAANRSELLSWVADSELIVLGSHFRGTSGGVVVSDGEHTYRFDEVG